MAAMPRKTAAGRATLPAKRATPAEADVSITSPSLAAMPVPITSRVKPVDSPTRPRTSLPTCSSADISPGSLRPLPGRPGGSRGRSRGEHRRTTFVAHQTLGRDSRKQRVCARVCGARPRPPLPLCALLANQGGATRAGRALGAGCPRGQFIHALAKKPLTWTWRLGAAR
eukprot:scaffold881_cov387-Prasinococcus_capsulatus_cf.AAC.5